MANSIKCPKCGGEMEEGLITDKGHLDADMTSQIWGTKIKGLFKTNVENSKNVIVYRCKNCGYLESYTK